jgi:hypothetical protein
MKISERVYGFLLGLYPRTFLREFGEPMHQAFRDQLRQAGYPTKVAALWLRSIVDLGRSIPSAWLRRVHTDMTKFGFRKYNEQARRAVFFARMEAERADSDTVTPEHLLVGLLTADRKLATVLLPQKNLFDVAAAISTSPQHARRRRLLIPLNNSCKEILLSAARRMLTQAETTIEPADLILAILSQPDSRAAGFLRNHAVDEARIEAIRKRQL